MADDEKKKPSTEELEKEPTELKETERREEDDQKEEREDPLDADQLAKDYGQMVEEQEDPLAFKLKPGVPEGERKKGQQSPPFVAGMDPETGDFIRPPQTSTSNTLGVDPADQATCEEKKEDGKENGEESKSKRRRERKNHKKLSRQVDSFVYSAVITPVAVVQKNHEHDQRSTERRRRRFGG